MQSNSQLLTAISDIIEGTSVKRSKHEMIFDGNIITDLFVDDLHRHRYYPVTVDKTNIEPGQRIQAFYLEDHTAYFGWVFWEKFSQLRLRKLFGTVVRNTKGDWLIPASPVNLRFVKPQIENSLSRQATAVQ